MPVMHVKFTKKESIAISEYASMCGNSIPDIIRKIVIQEITFMKNGNFNIPKIYEYDMLIPADISDFTEQKIIEANYNKIRKILGLKKIVLGWN